MLGTAGLFAFACGGSSTGAPTATVRAPTQTSAAGISTSTPETTADQAPRVLARLPEGKLLMSGAYVSSVGRPTYVVEGDRAIMLAPTEVTMSFDGNYASYLEQPNDINAHPTALVVRRIDAVDVLRIPSSPDMLGGAGWAPKDDRFSFQIGRTSYIRNISTGDQLQFEAPNGAHVQRWLGVGSKLLLVQEAGPGGIDRQLYIMDATSGKTSQLVMPANATIGPAGEYDGFSPDGRYVSYPVGDFQYGWDLWIMEIATGRTCLLIKHAPSHQYPQGVGWTPDSRSATYYAKYVFGGPYSDEHAVNAETCQDTAIEPTPPPPTATMVPIPGIAIGINGSAVSSPSGRYLLVYSHHDAIPTPRPGWTPPLEKPFWPKPSLGSAQIYIIDTLTGTVTKLVDEQRDFWAGPWLP